MKDTLRFTAILTLTFILGGLLMQVIHIKSQAKGCISDVNLIDDCPVDAFDRGGPALYSPPEFDHA